MKTTYLDNEIILLEGYKKDGTISHYQNRKLAEYKQIKQLLLHNVSQQRELLNALADDFNESTDTYVGQTRIESVLKAFNCG